MDLNQSVADFTLPDLDGMSHRLIDQRGRIVIVNFWSAECPHSERTDEHLLACLSRWGDGVVLLAIAANRNESAAQIAHSAARRGIPIVLLDSEHAVADAFEAVTTPHVFVLDRQGVLRYRGAVDNANFRQRTATVFHLQDAVESLRAGRLPAVIETPPYGCTIVRAN